jgi:multidrug transporter EmrE-like cation transporter
LKGWSAWVKRFTERDRLIVHKALMKTDLMVWSIVLLCAALFILCDGLSAHWGKTGSGRSLAIVMLLSPVCYFAFALINTRLNLAVTGALVNTIAVAGAVLVGAVFFKEDVSKAQYLGIALALAAVTLLNVD